LTDRYETNQLARCFVPRIYQGDYHWNCTAKQNSPDGHGLDGSRI